MSPDVSNYYTIRIELTGLNPDLLSAVLFQEGCNGIEEVSERIWLAYFSRIDSVQVSNLVTKLRQMNPNFEDNHFLISKEKEQDWNAEWKKTFQPHKIGKRIWVAPPWQKVKLKGNEILVIIEPQMAFGTGTHETTQLMMIGLEKYLKKGDTVLDAGSGSGILAILAKKLDSSYTYGFDLDPEAINNANHNALLNKIEDIHFQQGDQSIIPNRKFEVILANINKPVLIDLMPVLENHLQLNGKLIVSGVLEKDKYLILSASPSKLNVLELSQKNGWMVIVFQKIER